MNKRVEALIEQARKLTPEEREKLVARLQVELDDDDEPDGTPEEIAAAWSEELQRRIREIEKGEVELVPWETVLAELKK